MEPVNEVYNGQKLDDDRTKFFIQKHDEHNQKILIAPSGKKPKWVHKQDCIYGSDEAGIYVIITFRKAIQLGWIDEAA